MNDLIKREELLDYLRTIPIDLGYREMEDVVTFVEKMKSVNAVEVVRCKDCKHFDGECCDRYADETLGYSHSTQPNFFCACGERKTNG